MRFPGWPRGGLWRHPDFLRLWAAQAVSAFGTRITRTALPVLAILTLAGSPAEVALLTALSYGPAFLVGLVTGGWVDRSDKRRILVGADLVRALAVATVPLAAWAGHLGVGQVYVVTVVVGAATALFQIADVALLPRLVPLDRMVEGNSKIAATEAFAEVTGPAAAGFLIQALGAPLAVLVDAATYLWSAAFLRTLRRVDPPAGEAAAGAPVGAGQGLAAKARGLVDDLAVGMRTSFGHPVVGPLFAATGWTMFGMGFFGALYMLLALRTLGLGPAAVGAVIAVGGVGALGGTVLARRLPRRLGLGPTLVLSLAAFHLGNALVPLSAMPFVPRGWGAAFLVVQQLLGDACFMTFFILATSARQRLLPPELLGRVNASLQVVTGALLPMGALVAGPVAGLLGVRETLWIAVGLGALGPLVLAASKAVRTASEEPGERDGNSL